MSLHEVFLLLGKGVLGLAESSHDRKKLLQSRGDGIGLVARQVPHLVSSGNAQERISDRATRAVI